MVGILLGVGLLVAVFVGFNIGGSNTGPSFGPAVGAGAIKQVFGGVLMSGVFFIGGWNTGRRGESRPSIPFIALQAFWEEETE